VRGRCALGDVRALTDYRPPHPHLFSLFPLIECLIPSSSSISVVLHSSAFSIPTELPPSSLSISSDFHPPSSNRPLELPLSSFSIALVLFPFPCSIVPLQPPSPFSFPPFFLLPMYFFFPIYPSYIPLHLLLPLCYFLYSSSTSYLPPPRVLILFSLGSPLTSPLISGSVFVAVSRLF
jgi:hypothetical protein